MTGYGSGESIFSEAGQEIKTWVSLRSVNHRYLDVRLRMPSELNEYSSCVEEYLRKRLFRGRVEMTLRIEGNLSVSPKLNLERVRNLVRQLQTLKSELDPGQTIPFEILTAAPDLFLPVRASAKTEIQTGLLRACEKACDALDEMRTKEGEALEKDLHTRLGTIRTHLSSIRQRCPQLLDEYRQRLRSRIERLLEESRTSLDDTRLEMEIAILADRSDVSEEITRLESHLIQFAHCLGTSAPVKGKKLDFLLQEINREANTLGAKISDVEVTSHVVEIKTEIERLREQAQNIL